MTRKEEIYKITKGTNWDDGNILLEGWYSSDDLRGYADHLDTLNEILEKAGLRQDYMTQLNHEKKRQKLLKRAIDQDGGVAGLLAIVQCVDQDGGVAISHTNANLILEDEIAILELLLKQTKEALEKERKSRDQ